MNNQSLTQLLLETRVPYEQVGWYKRQPSHIQVLWLDCWLSNPYAGRWLQLVENHSKELSNAIRRESMQCIHQAGYFKFAPVYSVDSTEKVFSHFKCLNNYGAVMDMPRKCDPILPQSDVPVDYEVFLTSTYWKGVRQKVLLRDKYRCQKCGDRRNLQAHHLIYAHYKNELNHLNDLETLCRGCHSKLHNK